jgi:tetratricopeptide (TPR) repeat protein
VHHAVPRYQDNGKEIDVDMSIEDPRFEGDDPVARSIRQVEDIEGVQLNDKIKKVLYDDLKEANDKKRSFNDVVLQDIGSALTTDEIKRRLEKAATNNDAAGGTEELGKQWGLDGGGEAVKTAVAGLLNDNPGRDFVPYLTDVADQAADSQHYHLVAAVLDIVLAKQRVPTTKVVHLLELRGNARDAIGNFDGAVADWSLALSLKPDDAQVLNSLGWAWVEQDKNLDQAIDLLTRAVHVAPNDPEIRDSLGWADVKVGKTEEGLKLLQSAAAQKPDAAEIWPTLIGVWATIKKRQPPSHAQRRSKGVTKSMRSSNISKNFSIAVRRNHPRQIR